MSALFVSYYVPALPSFFEKRKGLTYTIHLSLFLIVIYR